MNRSLSIAIVIYQSNPMVLEKTIQSLSTAVSVAMKYQKLRYGELYIIDNNQKKNPLMVSLNQGITNLWSSTGLPIHFKTGHGNIGYGQGHNIAIFSSRCSYHLVLNPDVIMESRALVLAMDFMETKKQVGILAPKITHTDGASLQLIKRYPPLLTLGIRGLKPLIPLGGAFAKICRKRLGYHDYMEKNWSIYQHIDDGHVSGCFMLFRNSCLKKIHGFSPAYFLYFEDYDISIRMRKVAQIWYNPEVCIQHSGGTVSKKGLLHIIYYIRSAMTFYRKYGWKVF